MARRHASKGTAKRSKPRPVDRKDSSIKRWDKLSDIPLDEEDQCTCPHLLPLACFTSLMFMLPFIVVHASRDQILLDGEDAQSDDEGEEDEVFALKGIPGGSEDESEDEEEEGEDGDEEENYEKPPPPKGTKSKGKQKADSPPLSGEDSESEEEEGWGRKKSAYYSSNAAELDSEDEEANEMEEQEAKRLQAKLRENMKDEDYGLGDIAQADTDEHAGYVVEDKHISTVELTGSQRVRRARTLGTTTVVAPRQTRFIAAFAEDKSGGSCTSGGLG